MKQLFLFLAGLLSVSPVLAQTGGSTIMKVPLAGKVVLRDVDDKYSAHVSSFEAPEPDGNRDLAEFRAMKAEVERRFPYRRATVNTQAKTTAALQPIIVRGFVPDSNTSIPPDNYMAVNNGIDGINVMNSRLSILNIGTGALTSRKTLQSFTTGIGLDGTIMNNPYYRYDPKVMYDQEADRFYFVTLAGINENNWIIVGFSQTSDPGGVWNFYKFYGNYGTDSTWFDYPTIALTKNEAFLTGNKLVFNGSFQLGFVRSVIYQMKKSDGYAGAALTVKIWDSVKYGGASVRNLFPVKGGGSLKGPAQHFLSMRNMAATNDSVFLVTVGDTIGGINHAVNVQAMKSNLIYGFPPNGRQPNTNDKLQTNDARVLGAYIENNEIQFVSTTVHPPTGADAIYHGTMTNVTTTPAVQASYITVDTMDFGFPNISFAGLNGGANSSIISFDYSGKAHHPGVAAVFWDGSAYSNLLEVRKGDSSIKQLTDTVQRWGDYTGSQPKWNGMGHVWIVGLYGRKNRSYGDWMALLRSPYAVDVPTTRPMESSATLYPNPAFQYVRLRFNLKEEANLHFALYAMNGSLIDGLLDTHCARGENELEFNVASLPPGQYIVKGTGAYGGVFMKKVFVKE